MTIERQGWVKQDGGGMDKGGKWTALEIRRPEVIKRLMAIDLIQLLLHSVIDKTIQYLFDVSIHLDLIAASFT